MGIVGACRKPRKDPSDLERVECETRTSPVCGGTLRRPPLPAAIREPPEDDPC